MTQAIQFGGGRRNPPHQAVGAATGVQRLQVVPKQRRQMEQTRRTAHQGASHAQLQTRHLIHGQIE